MQPHPPVRPPPPNTQYHANQYVVRQAVAPDGSSIDMYERPYTHNRSVAPVVREQDNAAAQSNSRLSTLLNGGYAMYQRHWLTYACKMLFNLPQILAVIIVLSTNLNTQLPVETYDPDTDTHSWVYFSGANACDRPIYIWSILYAVIRLFRMIHATSLFRYARSGQTLGLFRYTAIGRLNQIFSLFTSIWFIIGFIFIFEEERCNTFSYPPFTLAFALLMTMIGAMLAPCFVFLILIILFHCCAPCIIRVMARHIGLGDLPTSADQAALDAIHMGVYHINQAIKRQNQNQAHTPGGEEINHASVGEVSGVGQVANDSCPICLVDFEENEQIKVFPCSGRHAYHKECIDDWLKINAVCCMCRENLGSSENIVNTQRERDSGEPTAV